MDTTKSVTINNITASLLKPRTLKGAQMEYTLGDEHLYIIDIGQTDIGKRKIEIPLDMVGRFVSELQEIEKIMQGLGRVQKPG